MPAAQGTGKFFELLAYGFGSSGDDIAALDQLFPTLVSSQIHRCVAGLCDRCRADRSFARIPRRSGHSRIKVEAAVEEIIHVRPPCFFTFCVRISQTNLLSEGAAVWIRLFTERRHSFPVSIEHLLRFLIAAERDVTVVVTIFSAKVPCLDRAQSGNPDRWVRFLDWLWPDVDITKLGVFAVPGEGLTLAPGLDYQSMSFTILLPNGGR